MEGVGKAGPENVSHWSARCVVMPSCGHWKKCSTFYICLNHRFACCLIYREIQDDDDDDVIIVVFINIVLVYFYFMTFWWYY